MNYLSNISRIHNYWIRSGIECEVWDIFLCHFFPCAQQLEITNLPTRANFGPKKYPPENILDPRNTHEKIFWTHEGTMALDTPDPRWHVIHEI